MNPVKNEKIRVAYIVSTLARKGPTNQLFYILKYLDRTHFEALIITLSPEPKESLKSEFEKLGVKIVSLNTGRIEGLLRNTFLLKRHLSDFSPHVIQTQGIRADRYNVIFSKRYRTLTTIRNVPHVDYPMKFGRFKGKIMAKRHLAAYKRLNVVSCSYSNNQILNALNIPSITIQNGVDIDRFIPPTATDKSKLKEKYGLSEFQHVFITVGSLLPLKNVATIIHAFNKNHTQAALLIVGDGPERERLSTLAENKNIFFRGFTRDVVELLKCADFYISASMSEGLPNAVMEALASGLPAILSKIEPHRELVSGSILEDFLFDSCNIHELFQKIEKIQQIEVLLLSQQSRQIAEDRFSAKAMSEKYQRVYINLTKQHVFQL